FGRAGDFQADGLGGAIALIERGADVTFQEKAQQAAEAGATAAVIFNNTPREFTGALQAPASIPVVSISGDDGRRLRDLAQQGAVTAHVAVDAGVDERTTENVVATR